ncbi:Membrane-associated tyrosine- and threonine-specific cdc2-inhibitory kinase wee-1.3 [Trichinella spiralis]|uniref:Membrane-associated tyrosine- and threonine-specific cdc2-inhibitory kinase wee-1.3 n=1 Tax=Trichinella spiralis TaxID=6334 RepID=A0A0V1BVP4_TRISP|nr:Membrane-associated tyrosine- and threonine-specific cdc2-inhibitory kinase wee-1.3 [Trichinella spiralis]
MDFIKMGLLYVHNLFTLFSQVLSGRCVCACYLFIMFPQKMNGNGPTASTPMPYDYVGEGGSSSFSTKRDRTVPQAKRSRHWKPPALCRSFCLRYPKRELSLVTFKNDRKQSTKIEFPPPSYKSSNDGEYLLQCFTDIKRIGQGSFGEVFSVTSLDDGEQYAVKRSIEGFRNSLDRRIKLDEVEKHEGLPPHPNFVQFVRGWEECGSLYIQTELCDETLSDYANKIHDVPELTVWYFLIDLLIALKHLHDNRFVHLDLKPENIFLTKDEICKVGDFGLLFNQKTMNPQNAMEGDSKYLAVEALQGIIGPFNDIFSLGITILELASDLDVPKNGDVWHYLRTGQLPEGLLRRVSPELREVIRSMMHPEHDKRPTAAELLEIPAVKALMPWRIAYRDAVRENQFLSKVVIRWCQILLCTFWSVVISPETVKIVYKSRGLSSILPNQRRISRNVRNEAENDNSPSVEMLDISSIEGDAAVQPIQRDSFFNGSVDASFLAKASGTQWNSTPHDQNMYHTPRRECRSPIFDVFNSRSSRGQQNERSSAVKNFVPRRLNDILSNMNADSSGSDFVGAGPLFLGPDLLNKDHQSSGDPSNKDHQMDIDSSHSDHEMSVDILPNDPHVKGDAEAKDRDAKIDSPAMNRPTRGNSDNDLNDNSWMDVD